MPGVAGLIVVSATLDVASVVVAEAVLSLLGLGIQPPDASIGQMIRQSIEYLEQNWSQVFFPSAVLALMVLAFSYTGDGLRDALDPNSQRLTVLRDITITRPILLRIGEFSHWRRCPLRLCAITVNQLGSVETRAGGQVHRIPLLRGEQLVRALNRILALKDLGFSLEQIERMLDGNVSVDELRGMLLLRQADTEREVAENAGAAGACGFTPARN